MGYTMTNFPDLILELNQTVCVITESESRIYEVGPQTWNLLGCFADASIKNPFSAKNGISRYELCLELYGNTSKSSLKKLTAQEKRMQLEVEFLNNRIRRVKYERSAHKNFIVFEGKISFGQGAKEHFLQRRIENDPRSTVFGISMPNEDIKPFVQEIIRSDHSCSEIAMMRIEKREKAVKQLYRPTTNIEAGSHLELFNTYLALRRLRKSISMSHGTVTKSDKNQLGILRKKLDDQKVKDQVLHDLYTMVAAWIDYCDGQYSDAEKKIEPFLRDSSSIGSLAIRADAKILASRLEREKAGIHHQRSITYANDLAIKTTEEARCRVKLDNALAYAKGAVFSAIAGQSSDFSGEAILLMANLIILRYSRDEQSVCLKQHQQIEDWLTVFGDLAQDYPVLMRDKVRSHLILAMSHMLLLKSPENSLKEIKTALAIIESGGIKDESIIVSVEVEQFRALLMLASRQGLLKSRITTKTIVKHYGQEYSLLKLHRAVNSRLNELGGRHKNQIKTIGRMIEKYTSQSK